MKTIIFSQNYWFDKPILMKQDRVSNLKFEFPKFPPRPIVREVVLSLITYKGGLYFVNGSNEVLKTVTSDSFGFVEDSSLEKNPSFSYENIQVGESVKVEEYDDFYDLDFVLGFKIYIESNEYGRIEIIPPATKMTYGWCSLPNASIL